MTLGAAPRQEFERLALPHLGALYATAMRLARDPRQAEDLVQETYLRAFRFFHHFQRGTNIKAWLFKILTNSFINAYRQNARERRMWEEWEAAERAGAAAPAAAEPEAVLGGLSQEVQQALAALAPEFRLAVILCDLEDFSYKEIADIMDCPIGTVMSRLHRARRQLARVLHGYAEERGIVRPAAAAQAAGGEDEPIRLEDFRRRRGS